MSPREQIEQDFKDAFKERRADEISTLKMLKAALQNKEKEKQFLANKKENRAATAVLNDEEIVDVVSVEIKKLRDSITMFKQGGRDDLIEAAQKEIQTLLRYLPKQLTENEIKELAISAIQEIGASNIKDMGKVMALLTPKTKGMADNNLVSQIVKNLLS